MRLSIKIKNGKQKKLFTGEKNPKTQSLKLKLRLHYAGLEDYLQKIKIYNIDYLDI